MGLFDRFRSAPRPPKTVDRAVAFTLCTERFIERDWEGALAGAVELGREHKSLQILQIMLLSLQRIPNAKNNPEYQRIWDDAVESIRGTRGFDTVTLRQTMGQVSLDEALAAATNDRERCKAFYYAGAQHLNEGRFEDAFINLMFAANTEDGGWEQKFAMAEAVRVEELRSAKPLASQDATAVKSAASVLRAAGAKTQNNPKPPTR
jgi:hypothetical protein